MCHLCYIYLGHYYQLFSLGGEKKTLDHPQDFVCVLYI